ncbi:MAG: hypothetical protein A2138_02410 [Deltaproteobacteria bacterium RBG_16_71_12]|nr:MAG: hypothetical protein A2138_02410 [Deltaproteobacteria bacterium RBG_16_71_12]
MFFAREGADKICAVTVPDGLVRVVAQGSASVNAPRSLTLDGNDTLVVAVDAGANLKSVTVSTGAVSAAATPAPAAPVVDVDADAIRVQALLSTGVRLSVSGTTLSTIGGAAVSGASGLVVAAGSNTSIVFDGDEHAVRTIDGNGNGTDQFGSGTVGFLDGPAADARFTGNTHRIARLGTGVIVSDGVTIRRVDDGRVTTVVGSDQLTDDGRFPDARFSVPSTLSCAGTTCLVYDHDPSTLRRLDLAMRRVDRVLGADGRKLDGPLAGAVLLDEDTVVFSNGDALLTVELPDGAITTFADGVFVVSPLQLALAGQAPVFVDGLEVKILGGSPRVLFTSPDQIDAIGASPNGEEVAVVHGDGVVDLVSLVGGAPATLTLPAAVFAEVGEGVAVAVDDDGNVFLGDRGGVEQVFRDGTTRPLLRVGPLFPRGCARALALDDAGDLLLANCETGAILRVAIR